MPVFSYYFYMMDNFENYFGVALLQRQNRKFTIKL